MPSRYSVGKVFHISAWSGQLIVRHNLTVQGEEGQADLPAFFAAHGVTVVASLPCYAARNVDAQRGRGVFDKSIRALKRLNDVGFGRPTKGLTLTLVHNPTGPFLPPDQRDLEADYRQRLRADFGIEFSNLVTITNMPIQRFARQLERDGQLSEYRALLIRSFNPSTVPKLMCGTQVNVGWAGGLYDCDFNQMLELKRKASIFDIDSFEQLAETNIITADHCFGCTAGFGSSCTGALANA